MSTGQNKSNPTYTGLSDSQVLENRRKYGINILTPAQKEPVWRLFLKKFNDPLIIILIVAGVFSIAISLYEYLALDLPSTVFFEPTGIFMAVLLATGLGFIFEHQAEKEFEILNRVNDDEQVQVIRNNGIVSMVPRRDIVVGDYVIINTGDEVPADGELLSAVSLTIDESTLTGEPSCAKTTDSNHFDPEATFPSNHVMRGTKVLEGHAVMRVFAVGDKTENGKVFKAVQIDNSVKTPLNEQLDRLGRLITRLSYTIATFVIIGRTVMYFINMEFDWIGFITYFLQTIMVAVALVAVAIPEGLPMAVTLSLAYSMKRMLKTNNLVRKMHACETMGAVTVICTDKTGTLTQNKMQVVEANFFGADNNDPIVTEGMAVNSTALLNLSNPSNPAALGNPTEGALLMWLYSQGIDYQSIRLNSDVVEELPFTTENKYMATIVRTGANTRRIYVKGAPEIITGMVQELPQGTTIGHINNLLEGYQNKAMRTLAFAYADLQETSTPIVDGRLVNCGLKLCGIVAICDPIRPDVPDAIGDCIKAGIRVTIVTGDTVATARQIAREIGLWTDDDDEHSITTGPELSAMTDEELRQCVQRLKIVARARPMDKKRLVETLEQLGDVVAATGDGTNDAPALKAAQVGLSMGDGTSVAKEASDITIIDNSFASIRRAVMWGRSLYKNIQRFVLFQMTVNVAACLIVLLGAFTGTQSPLSVTQMLWVNLIMDTFAAMALASLPPDPSVMHEKPRLRTAFIISPSMFRFIGYVGGGFFVLLTCILLYMQHYNIDSLAHMFGHNPLNTTGVMTPYELSLFFTIFVFLQYWNLFNARAFGTECSTFDLQGCSGFIAILAIVLVGQVLIVSVGGQFFNVCPIRFTDWCIIIASTSLVAVTGGIIHIFRKHRPIQQHA